MPWIVGVTVKEPIGFSAVNSLTPAAAREAIRLGAREAVGRIPQAQAFSFGSPLELVVETVQVEHADFIELMPGFSRIGSRAVRFATPEYPALMQAFIAATRIAAAADPVA